MACGVSSVRTKEDLLVGGPETPCVTEIAAWAEDSKPSLVALNVTVEDPIAAEEETVRVTDAPPNVIEKGDVGVDVTPLRRPATETSSGWLNPFTACTERPRLALCPGLRDWLCGLTLIEKLGEVEPPDPDELEPPPHEDRLSTSSDSAKSWARCRDPLRRRYLPYF